MEEATVRFEAAGESDNLPPKVQARPLTPKELAPELQISEQRLRLWLRDVYPRPWNQRNTRWMITPEMAEYARAYWDPDGDFWAAERE